VGGGRGCLLRKMRFGDLRGERERERVFGWWVIVFAVMFWSEVDGWLLWWS
jgi:hypothetical protein